MSEVAMCSEMTFDGWHTQRCRRPVKRDGLCGPHAAGKARSEKAKAARNAAWDERQRIEREAAARQQELLDAEQAVIRVRALLDGAPMVSQAEVRRALDAATPADSTRAVGHE